MPRSSLYTRASLLLRLHDAPDDTSAREEFVRIYSRHVVRWCRRYGLQENDAQDVAQDVLVRFWQHAAAFEYDPSQRFRGYLRRIVTSVVSDRTRRRKAETLGRSAEVQQLLDSAPAREDLIARIEAAYDTELMAVAMRDVEGRVKPHTWRAFQMLALEGHSGAAVAEELGMEVNTAYVARKKVQRMIREVVVKLGGDDGEGSWHLRRPPRGRRGRGWRGRSGPLASPPHRESTAGQSGEGDQGSRRLRHGLNGDVVDVHALCCRAIKTVEGKRVARGGAKARDGEARNQ